MVELEPVPDLPEVLLVAVFLVATAAASGFFGCVCFCQKRMRIGAENRKRRALKGELKHELGDL